MVLSGGYLDADTFDYTTRLDGESLKFTKELAPMQVCRDDHDAVYCKGSIFVFGGYIGADYDNSIEKYSLANNTWEYVGRMYNDIKRFCACAFMDQIYIIGGMAQGLDVQIYDEDDYTDLCMEFNTKYNKWIQVARMNEVRSYAASAVFEGKIVVSGGNFGEIKNTVEAYDRVDNSWTPMPKMIEGRNGHASVGMRLRNRLFVIG